MKPQLATLTLAVLLMAGCHASPVADFERDSLYDLGNPNLPPIDLTAQIDNDDSFLVSWGAVAQQTENVIIEQSYEGGPYTRAAQVSRLGNFVSIPINAPGRYVFRAVSQRANGSFGMYSYTDTLSTSAPPTFVAATFINATTLGVSWGLSNRWAVKTAVEMKRDGGPFVPVAEVEHGVRFLPVALPGPGSYTFRVASRASDGTTGPYIYTGTFSAAFPPLTVAATFIDSTTFGVSWSGALPWTQSIRVDRKKDDGPFVQMAEVEPGVRFVPVPITGPGSYTFQVIPRLSDGSFGPTSATGTFTVR